VATGTIDVSTGVAGIMGGLSVIFVREAIAKGG